MATYIIRDHESKKFWGLAVAHTMAMLWDLVDTEGDPFYYEYAELDRDDEFILFAEKRAFPEKDLHKSGEGERGDKAVKVISEICLNEYELSFHSFDASNEGAGLLARIREQIGRPELAAEQAPTEDEEWRSEV